MRPFKAHAVVYRTEEDGGIFVIRARLGHEDWAGGTALTHNRFFQHMAAISPIVLSKRQRGSIQSLKYRDSRLRSALAIETALRYDTAFHVPSD